MNAARRKNIAKVSDLLDEARALLSEVIAEEQDALDNMPDSLRDADRGQQMEEYISAMDDAMSEIEAAIDQIAQ